ncbi:MAG: hypothetical protein WBX77_16510 [Pseudolabrys sp.]
MTGRKLRLMTLIDEFTRSPPSLWVRFTATERREGRRHRVLIEPSLDDPCTALCIIDRAPKPRAADGKLSEVS